MFGYRTTAEDRKPASERLWPALGLAFIGICMFVGSEEAALGVPFFATIAVWLGGDIDVRLQASLKPATSAAHVIDVALGANAVEGGVPRDRRSIAWWTSQGAR